MALGSDVDWFVIDFLTYHDYSGGNFRTGMAAIRALSKYDGECFKNAKYQFWY